MKYIKTQIIGYLENHTSFDNLWIPISDLIQSIELNPGDDNNSWHTILNMLFIDMINDRQIRINKDDNDGFIISLESMIQEKINSNKLSAIDEMKSELQKYVEIEEYEKAAEYRDMINLYESKLE